MASELRKRNSEIAPAAPRVKPETNQTRQEESETKVQPPNSESNHETKREQTEEDVPMTASASLSTMATSPRMLLFFFLLTASLFLTLRIYSPIDAENDFMEGSNVDGQLLHAVVFDAGSTGTRIHVFQFVKKTTKNDDDDGDYDSDVDDDSDFTVELLHESFDHIEPGLSAYADDPQRIRPGLKKLLQVAVDEIPASKLSSTPVILKATAGLRLLPPAKAEALLREVRSALIETGFRLRNEEQDVSILDGVDEGFYGWITVNYLLGRLGAEAGDKPKVATMDLGGGSTQITFDLTTDKNNNNDASALVPREFTKAVEILGERVQIYTRSYLGLGIMAARLAILKKGSGVSDAGDVDVDNHGNRVLVSPCLPPWHEDVWVYGGVEYRVKAADASASASSPSTTTWTDCFSHASSVVAAASVNKIPRQIVETRDIYAFSYYFDRLLEVGLISDPVSGGVVIIDDVVDAASQVCRHFPFDKRPFLCMDLTHIAALLTSPSGLGFEGKDKLFLRKKIAGKEASWSLGSAFSLI